WALVSERCHSYCVCALHPALSPVALSRFAAPWRSRRSCFANVLSRISDRAYGARNPLCNVVTPGRHRRYPRSIAHRYMNDLARVGLEPNVSKSVLFEDGNALHVRATLETVDPGPEIFICCCCYASAWRQVTAINPGSWKRTQAEGASICPGSFE